MKDFQFPEKFVWEQDTYKPNYGKLTIEPLIRGYGVTVGNALRRVLLSSLWGVAVTSIKIDGVLHEFTKMEGIKEDMVEVVMNLKQMHLKSNVTETDIFPRVINVQLSKKGPITASDLIVDTSLEALNGDLHIMTLTKDKKISIDLEITDGRGYISSDNIKRSKGSSIPLGTIIIDALYSPVRKITYNVENILYKTSHDYEKLTIEVYTTGALDPMEAMNEATNIITEHFGAIKVKQVIGEEVEKHPVEVESKEIDDDIHLSDFKFSTRICNGLKQQQVTTLQELLNIPKEDWLEIKNFGKKSIEEIETKLAERGYKLKSKEELEQEAKNET
jgi:DNA-directed RNA polymerase subunit alpha